MILNRYAVLIPYYNKYFCIEDCLDSVEDAASMADIKVTVLVLDDGSEKKFTDTESSRKQYSHLNLLTLYRPNTKLSGARRDAIKEISKYVNGETYIIHLDADDTLAHDAFNKIDKYINRFPDVDIIITQFYTFTNKVFIPYYKLTYKGTTPVIYDKVYKTKIEWMYHANHNLMNKLVKLKHWKKVINKGVSFMINKAEDAYLSAKLFYECETMVYSDVYFYRYQFDAPNALTFEPGALADLNEMHAYNICKFLSFMKEGVIRKFEE